MPVPENNVFAQGQGAVGAGALNTFVQGCFNLAALRAFTGVSNMVVLLQGYTSPNDGGQGDFYWDPNATGPDNGTTIIVPTGAVLGAWVRLTSTGSSSFDQFTPYALGGNVTAARSTVSRALTMVSYLDYGAVGNGTTDNTAALNSWIADVNAGVNRVLYVPPGRFLHTGNTTPITSAYEMYGSVGLSFMETNGGTTTFLNAQLDPIPSAVPDKYSSRCTIEGITFNSSVTTPVQQCIEFNYTSSFCPVQTQVQMRNVTIGPGFAFGVRTVNCIGATFYNVNVTGASGGVSNPTLRAQVPWAFKTDATTGFYSLGHQWTNCQISYLTTAWTGSGNLQGYSWIGCYWEFIENGWALTGTGGTGLPTMQINGGQGETFTLAASFTNFAFVQITNAQFLIDGASSGITLTNSQNSMVSNCILNGATGSGIQFVNSFSSIVRGNQFNFWSGTSVQIYVDPNSYDIETFDNSYASCAGTCFPYVNGNVSATGATNTRRSQRTPAAGPDPALFTGVMGSPQTIVSSSVVLAQAGPMPVWQGDRMQLQGWVLIDTFSSNVGEIAVRIREYNHRPGTAAPFQIIETFANKNFLFDVRPNPQPSTGAVQVTFSAEVDIIGSAADALFVIEAFTDNSISATVEQAQIRSLRA